MADLITNKDTWNKWKGHMPVIDNKASSPGAGPYLRNRSDMI